MHARPQLDFDTTVLQPSKNALAFNKTHALKMSLLSVALLICTQANAQTYPQPNTQDLQPLTVCTEASPDGFDVVRFNALTTTNASADALMDRLVEFDADKGVIIPGIASNWKTADDGLSVRFTLGQSIAFHETPWFKPTRFLSTDDVIYSFERMMKPEHPWYKSSPSGYPHAENFNFTKLIKSIEKVDDHTLVFHLNYPDATFIPTLTMGFASIYSKEYLEQLATTKQFDQLNQKPVGTGPFVLEQYVKDSQIRYAIHPNYFKGAPKLKNLVFAITPDAQVRLSKIAAGECDIALSANPREIETVLKNTELKKVSTPAFMTAFVALNTEHGELAKKEVRQAINYAFDKKAYVKAVFDNTAIPANGVYPPNTWSYKAQPAYDLNIEKAKRLLEAANFDPKFKPVIWISNSSSGLNPNPKLGAQLLQADLAKIGIDASIRQTEWGELIASAKAGEHDLLFMGWAGDNGDPDNFLTPLFSCDALKSGINFARYCDKPLDNALKAGKRTSDTGEWTTHYETAQAKIHDEALWIPLAHPEAIAITHKKVTNFHVSPFGRVILQHIELK